MPRAQNPQFQMWLPLPLLPGVMECTHDINLTSCVFQGPGESTAKGSAGGQGPRAVHSPGLRPAVAPRSYSCGQLSQPLLWGSRPGHTHLTVCQLA